MLETDQELDELQALLDRSAAAAGPHMSDILTEDRRLTAADLCRRLQGMCLLALATTTADGRPLTGAVDGYLLHGSFYFSTGRNAVRARHLAARPAVSATYLPDEHLAVSVHGRAEIFDVQGDEAAELRQAMLDHYLPKQGPAFQEWLDTSDGVAVRIVAEKLFTLAAD